MLTIESIAQKMQDTSATNGWDAVFAMNLKQVNSLFFQEFLQVFERGPAGIQTYLRCSLSDQSALWILDAHLGPAELSFQTGESKAQVQMELISGVLITLDAEAQTIVNAAWVRPNESNLTGPLELTKVEGTVNQIGAVVMDLGAAAYTPTIGGVDPESLLNTNIGEAARTFFHNNAATYTLGIIGNADVSPSLAPTTFRVTTQQHPSKPDSCVLVLIQTNGQPGTVGPLATYPIPDNAGAVLLIAEGPLFNALGDDLNKSFGPFGTRFTSHSDGNGWSTSGSGGAIDCGAYGAPFDCSREREWDRSQMPWTSDSGGGLSSVRVGLDGFTVSASSGQLVAAWSHRHAQYVSTLYRNPGGSGIISLCAVRSNPSTVQVDFKVLGAPSVDPGSSKVSFKFTNPTLTVTPVDGPSFWERLWGATSISSAITNALDESLLGTLKSFTAVNIDAFRLKCLLFQSPDTVQLNGAALPKGVFLTGNAAMPIAITPACARIAPGGTAQFSATRSNLFWEIKPPNRGSMNHDSGLYTAPSSISSAEIVVVTAVDKSNSKVFGKAMVLVYQSPAAQGLAVMPSRSLVTPGHATKLYTVDAAGKALTVDWTLSPNIGSIKQGLKQGEYNYTAPITLSEITVVTATAKDHSNPNLAGWAVIQVTPFTSIAVNPPQSSVKVGSSLTLTATVTAGDPQKLAWVLYPSSLGKITFDLNHPATAIYTAPASTTVGNQVTALAYLVDSQAAGLGSSTIMLTS